MGFFSNLKNAITGGAAQVQIQIPQVAQRGQTITVNISATAKGAGNVKQVYLQIRATETASFDHTFTLNGQSKTERVSGSKVTYEQKVVVAPAFQLAEGQSYTFQGQLPLPPTTNPSFHGQIVHHTWEVLAGFDMTGNDPDSGWQQLTVQ